MLDTMSKRKPRRPTGGKNTSPREAFHLPAELREALTEYVAAQRPETDKSAVMRHALEEYLKRVGYWPPGGQSDN
jgi:hypothetical protein